MYKTKTMFNQLFILWFVLSILVVSSGKSQSLTENISNKIIQADLKEVTLIEHAKLE